MQELVDAVITWVDGNDPAHQKKLATYLENKGIERPYSAHPTRYNQCGEIEYCIRSIWAYAPWINRVFIVTDNQTPSFLETLKSPLKDKIILIDHRTIFRDFEAYLPTFNSLSLESVLWRIPRLSNQFIYFNDDCFLIRPVKYEDFFQDHSLVIRGEWKKQHHKKWFNKNKTIDDHRHFQERSAQLAGYSKYFFHLPHIPFALQREDFDLIFQEQHLLQKNLQFPFRDKEQFHPISFMHHLAIKSKRAIIDSQRQSIMINAETHSQNKVMKRMNRADKKKGIVFACIQSMDMASDEKRQLLIDWLNKRIPTINELTKE
ncbi:Capsular polysaccharide phosphotransferase SacB (plasmid) [Legionella adelaidensis]|uniref:Capsular polysaccharide phosphotransferase SacB n=1 Tax=Legionella adelaidensis TaxID=45056 RepID=A0A0W0R3M3_9GAMM|nr:stealth family protein [Legionella adelaidensis]KTC65626.1 Capsular polysaccharide phosphotransferase cps12A [Legionella adelaidensis]VEH85177.1 Capsular polysaccharide phosphotransferase SacB [Legionella adelaidensis]